MFLDTNTKVETVERRFGEGGREKLRESKARREHLEKRAIMSTNQEVFVQVSGDRAYADLADADTEFGYTDRKIINVRADVPEQTETSVPEGEWDLMVQETDLYHEIGHLKWTDWPAVEAEMVVVDDPDQALFKKLFDAFEDAFIEPRAADRFGMENEFRITNENLLKQNDEETVSILNAIVYRLWEEKHPLGWHEKLVDPADADIEFLTDDDRETYVDTILPALEDTIEAYLAETDAEERPAILREFVDDHAADIKGTVKSGDTTTPTFDMEAISPDTTANDGSEGEEAPAAAPDDDDDGDGGEPAELSDSFEMAPVKQDARIDYSDEVDRQRQEVGTEASVKSAEEWVRVIQTDYDDDIDPEMEVVTSAPGTFDQDAFEEAKRMKKPLARELEQRLQKQRASQKQKKKSTGKVDTSQMKNVSKGKTNVFQNTSKPDAKDYSAVIAVDRSGSMSNFGNSLMTPTEEAAGALAMALEEVEVETAVMSMFDDLTRLEKDFPESVADAKEKMFNGRADGGTPLSDTLALARERLDQQGGHPFVIVLTDGKPDHRELYRDQLAMCDFPVVGIYIREDDEDFDQQSINASQYFHKLEHRPADEALAGARSLVKDILF
ncbi:hypothetical protein Z052_01845 [Halorubrum sp. C191]|uniref:vWA domain-containing protein n=1 Tax=Halorubrum sp. C191 TaxID=1383842 RepID=UPI000C06C12E|nr:VWA domain-containing protein [Halorubrum sp. C191]PHQ43905.1 hypothetical protein Z052_01845 [Halorubrum sp. C191]